MRYPLLWLPLALLLLASGCGAQRAKTPTAGNACPTPSRGHGPVPDLALLRTIEEISKKIAPIAGVKIELRLSLNPQANAFAWSKNNQNQIALTTGLLELVGENPDEYAFVIAHEIAHLADRHLAKQEERQTELNQSSGMIGFALDLAGMGLGIPLGGMLSTVAVDTGSHLVARQYDREQERRADELGLGYMIKGGYNPEGALSFLDKLRAASSDSVLPLLSTHPGGTERLARISARLKELAPATLKEWPEAKEKDGRAGEEEREREGKKR